MVRRLLQAGRLNRFYPDPEALDNLFRLLTPSGSHGQVTSLEIGLRTGLPTEPALGRVLAERDLSEKFLAGIDPEALRRKENPSDVDRRLLQRAEYHADLAASRLPKRTHLELALRRVEEEKHRAYFTTVFERFDPTEGIFVRYTVQLYQHHGRWSRPLVELQGDDMEFTTPFRNVISRYHSDEAEFAYILLSELRDITVEEVVRARVGPLWFEGVEVPPAVDALLQQHPGSFILHFPSERAAGAIKEDRNNDPFSRMYRESLTPEAREVAEKKAGQLGYHVYKERKFACTRQVAGPFKELLASLGARCVVYAV